MISNERFLSELTAMCDTEIGVNNCYQKNCCKLKLEDIFTTDSVYIAANHCAKGFRNRPDTARFMAHAWANSMLLADSVIKGRFKPEYYQSKEIIERGKPRIIRPPKFECKVVQKVLCDYILRATLESKMIYTNYASIHGRGGDLMHENILKALHKGKPGNVIVLIDYSGFFASINTNIICEKFLSFGFDKHVVSLFHSFDPEGVGLSLGNEVSQIPASWFPSMVDHALKDKYGYKEVHRYMDDSLILCEDINDAERCIDIVREYAQANDLIVKDEKQQTIPYGKEFIFCKEHYYVNKHDHTYYRIQNPAIARTEKRKIKRFKERVANGEMTQERAQAQIRSVVNGMKKHPNNYKKVREVEGLAEECGIETGPEP